MSFPDSSVSQQDPEEARYVRPAVAYGTLLIACLSHRKLGPDDYLNDDVSTIVEHFGQEPQPFDPRWLPCQSAVTTLWAWHQPKPPDEVLTLWKHRAGEG